MKIWLLVFAFLVGCINKKPVDKVEPSTVQLLDSIPEAEKVVEKSELFDTTGLHLSPVKILKAGLIEREYSNYRDISMTYKNVSKKKITGIRFKWFGINAFGEAAAMGDDFFKGMGGGFDDDLLLPGRTKTGSWAILSKDGKKVTMAWPYEVVFLDGSKWKIGEPDMSQYELK